VTFLQVLTILMKLVISPQKRTGIRQKIQSLLPNPLNPPILSTPPAQINKPHSITDSGPPQPKTILKIPTMIPSAHPAKAAPAGHEFLNSC